MTTKAATKENPPLAEPKPESVLSLAARGALPEILRKIADEIDANRATAEQFACTVGRENFELRCTIHLHP